MSKILVTGANGYIARHMILALLDQGMEPVGLDSGVNSRQPELFFGPLGVPYYHGDIADQIILEDIFAAHDIGAVIHFAGLIYIGESFERPHAYYHANTTSALTFFHFVMRRGVKNIVFSSTAGVYGESLQLPIPEDHPRNPINPYGRSKLATEWILEDMARLYPDVNITMLRYFNVAGADPQQRTGPSSPKPRLLVEVACEAALGMRNGVDLFGTDYKTQDGTCIRDYIHVSDLADAHLAALSYNKKRNEPGAMALNCGYGQGYSNRQIIECVKNISGVDFPVREGPRREGDPAALVAGNEKILNTLAWTPRHNQIETIVRTAYAWKKRQLP